MKAVDSAPYLFMVSETQSLSEAVTKSPQLVVISRLVRQQQVTVKLVTVNVTFIFTLILHQARRQSCWLSFLAKRLVPAINLCSFTRIHE